MTWRIDRLAVLLTLLPLYGLLPLLSGSGVFAQSGSAVDDQFFESRIRPLLVEKCQACHGHDQQTGGLNLATADGFSKGADSGPLVDPTNPENSRILRAVRYQDPIKMPPSGRLSDREIATLERWLMTGAPWPDSRSKEPDATSAEANETGLKQREEKFWSFRPLKPIAPPEVQRKGWIKSELDRFILAKLESEGIEPAPTADRATLLRRATFDLTGLPPTEAELDDFVNDGLPDAFARVVDRLLSSPRYGERWGRHWLDLARFADSTGADEDHRYPHAWRYRDYVVEAFNRDLPYDRFVREQVAGDLMPPQNPGEANVNGIVATGFLALGPKLLAEIDKPKMFYDIVDEQIDVTSQVFLGLTLACARCHDHKFDPLPTRDYYSLAAIFASTKQLSKLEGSPVVSTLYFRPLVPAKEAREYEAHQRKLEEQQAKIDSVIGSEGRRYRKLLAPQLAEYMLAARRVYQEGAEAADLASSASLDVEILPRWVEYLTPTQERRPQLENWYAAGSPELERVANAYEARFIATLTQRDQAIEAWEEQVEEARAAGLTPPEKPKFLSGTDRFFTQVTSSEKEPGPFAILEKEREQLFSETANKRLQSLKSELKSLETSGPKPPLACAVAEGEDVDQHVLIRGNPRNPGIKVPKGLPVVLAGEDQPPISSGSGRRELAEWLADPENPLTARVMANRIWQWHFGEGIVRTPNNFGKMGERPSHPELLDYLTLKFIMGGWSIKSMHRFMMLSTTYQMSTAADRQHLARDPDNRLWSRFNFRRLQVEEIRDGLLSLDGSLDLTMGGSLMSGEGTDKEFSEDRKSMDPNQSRRRTIYLFLRRSNLPNLMTLFDFGDATTTNPKRFQTSVAPQALYMMNSGFVEERARSLAQKLLEDDRMDEVGRIGKAHRVVLGKRPRTEQIEIALNFLEAYPSAKPGLEGRLQAWTSFCRTLIASNDFIYVN